MFLNGATSSVFVSRARAPSFVPRFGCSAVLLLGGAKAIWKSMVRPTKEALEVAYSSSILSGRQFIGVRAAAKIKVCVLVSYCR